MSISRVLGIALVALAAAGLAPNARASLIGETFNASIQITGSDDNGFYDINVFNGTITGAAGPEISTSVFKQLTFSGFHTASNQITGSVTVDVGVNSIAVNFSGQAQPFELQSTFTNIPDTITAEADSATGLLAGVNLDLSHSFTAHSVSMATFYLGFQPGTNVTQTETLTLVAATAVPEPSTLLIFGFALIGIACIRRRRHA